MDIDSHQLEQIRPFLTNNQYHDIIDHIIPELRKFREHSLDPMYHTLEYATHAIQNLMSYRTIVTELRDIVLFHPTRPSHTQFSIFDMLMYEINDLLFIFRNYSGRNPQNRRDHQRVIEHERLNRLQRRSDAIPQPVLMRNRSRRLRPPPTSVDPSRPPLIRSQRSRPTGSGGSTRIRGSTYKHRKPANKQKRTPLIRRLSKTKNII